MINKYRNFTGKLFCDWSALYKYLFIFVRIWFAKHCPSSDFLHKDGRHVDTILTSVQSQQHMIYEKAPKNVPFLRSRVHHSSRIIVNLGVAYYGANGVQYGIVK
jgi:hypothetical protein